MSALKHCLTPHERSVLALIADGKANGDIAQHLGVSPGYVQQIVHRIYRKLSAHSRRHAVWMYLTGDAFVMERERAELEAQS